MVENYNLEKDEFISFLLLFTANIDVVIDEKEIDFIKSHLSQNSKYKKVYEIFNKCSDSECIEIIDFNVQKYFKTLEAKENIMKEVEILLKIDDNFSSIEQYFLLAIRRIVFN